MNSPFRYFQNVMNPDAYHGHDRRGPFFEGWYFKLINAAEDQRWCIIPGAYTGKNPADSHAFIQVMDGSSGQSIYQPYEFHDFQAARGRFELSIQGNYFSPSTIALNIQNPEINIKGEVRFGPIHPWPVSIASPGIMGWYAWAPTMECYHGVVSFNHSLQGELEINGKKIDFTGGRGYIEKDWGISFPKAWIWMQTNHFSQPGICLTASTAIIPWRGHTFNGFIAGLWNNGRLERFATYTGAQLVETAVTDTEVRMVMAQRARRLELTASRAEGGILQAPTTTQMNRRITETLSAHVHVKLLSRKGSTWITEFDDTGRHAGLEAMGQLNG